MEMLNSGNLRDQTRLRRLDEDLISNLPDPVLQHILSFVSTKDAVRTSTMSRRWQNLWKFVPCLDLGTDDFSEKNDFLNFMDKFVNLRGNSDLQKFMLIYDNSSGLETYYPLRSWIDTIVTCKLQHLDIYSELFHVYYNHRVKMPQSLFLCSTLVVLKLSCMVVEVSDRVSLPCLKVMHLDEVLCANDLAFKTLISSCPALEELSISRSDEDNIELMSVCSQTLKSFSIKGNYPMGVVNGIVIDAPHLEYLSLSDHQSKNFVPNGLDSCLKAKIDVAFSTDYEGCYELKADDTLRCSIRRFLVDISNVKSLSFTGLTLELLSEYLKFDLLPQFHGVIHLKTKFENYEWEVLPALFGCCPNLKSFVMNCYNESSNPLVPPLRAPQCLLSLESITPPRFYKKKNEAKMGLVRYFLENAVVLQKVTIRVAKSTPNESVTNILKKLLMFPRRSPTCRIIVK